jgi:NAD(P)-dependent dehydrogenase (short-subunit alcohol dehydrogenase family)
MDIRFDGKVCVVTGAGSGIGFTCAKIMAESGAKVAMVGRNPEKIQKAAEMLAPFGQVKGYALDVANVPAIADVVAAIRAEMGEISYLIQAAGIMDGGPAVELTEEKWDHVMNANAKGLFFMMQQVVKQSMIPAHSGAIVNIASMAGIRGMTPPMCSAHYSASKGAVVALTRQGAVEWAADGIRVNAIAPGGVLSMGVGVSAPMPTGGPGGPGGPGGNAPGAPGPGPGGPTTGVPSGRLSDPDEIAGLCAYLLCDLSANTTGQIMVVDGGSSVVGY